MSSPRSMWSGTLQIGLLNVPVTIGKAWTDERAAGLRDFCPQHHDPIDRSERCEGCQGTPQFGKVKGIIGPDDKLHILSETELIEIEDATKSPTLEMLDVQPLADLPMEYAVGTYYLRADKKVPGSEQPFAILAAALAKTAFAIVSKWCNATKQKLVVIHEQDGILLMRHLPMAHELRLPGEQEQRHQVVAVNDGHVNMAVKLLRAAKGRKKFSHGEFEDEGLNLRREAINRLLSGDGEKRKKKPSGNKTPAPDIMSALQASLESVKQEV